MSKYLHNLLYLCFMFFVATSVFGQVTNSNISNGFLFDGEPYLAINPINPQNLVTAWMGIKFDGGEFRVTIKTRASFDGGSNWSSINTLPHFGAGFGSADVSMAFDKNGMLFISYIDYKQNPDSGGIYVARSTNGGLTWDSPSKAFDVNEDGTKRPIDRPWLVVDKSNTINEGTLYITTKPAPWVKAPNRNYFKSSSDKGFTWTTIANVDGGNFLVGNFIAAPMATPAVDASGNFLAIYPSYVPSQNLLPSYYLAKSSNKGMNFNYTTVFSAIPASQDTNLKNGYLMLADPLDSNKMVFLLPNGLNGDADISCLSSNDGGKIWSLPVRVNNDPIGNGKDQDMVWGSYNENGKLLLTWRDRRNTPTKGFWDVGYDFYFATSNDNGNSFSDNKVLSSQVIAFDSLIAQNGNDFMSCVYHGDSLYTVWGDTRNGKMNIYFAKTIVSKNTSSEIVLLNNEDEELKLFPNPAIGEINIEIPYKLAGNNLLVFDDTGKKILSLKAKSTVVKIDVSTFSKGVYFIKIENHVTRFVKN